MDNYFIKKNLDDTWGFPEHRPDLSNYNLEDLRQENYYPLTLDKLIDPGYFKKIVINYELVENEVFQRRILVDKEGKELADSIRIFWIDLRLERDQLLRDSDWTQVLDAPITTEERQAWAFYRQQLRDLTSNADYNNITWPVNPKGVSKRMGYRVL